MRIQRASRTWSAPAPLRHVCVCVCAYHAAAPAWHVCACVLRRGRTCEQGATSRRCTRGTAILRHTCACACSARALRLYFPWCARERTCALRRSCMCMCRVDALACTDSVGAVSCAGTAHGGILCVCVCV